MTTRARVLNVNVRRSDVPTLYSWAKRRPGLIALINRQKPSIVTVQECTETQEKDLLAGFGAYTKTKWESYDHGNSGVLWDTSKWKAIKREKHDLTAPKGFTRRLTLVRLQSLKTGEHAWFGATHLSVHIPSAATWRIRQAGQICGHLEASNTMIVGGDYNDTSLYNRPGPRQVFYQKKNMTGLRGKVKVKEADLNTHHGFKPPKRQGLWLDDIETGTKVKVYRAAVIPTGNNTDHNALFAQVEFT